MKEPGAHAADANDQATEETVTTILGDPEVNGATLERLRAAYRELRSAYAALYEKHHGRIIEALADLKEEGKKTGGDVPYGYRLGDDGETLVEDETEQAVIAEAVRLREQGLSLRRIARELWRQKIRPRPVPRERRRGSLKTKRHGEFDPTQIRRMIEAHRQRVAFE